MKTKPRYRLCLPKKGSILFPQMLLQFYVLFTSFLITGMLFQKTVLGATFAEQRNSSIQTSNSQSCATHEGPYLNAMMTSQSSEGISRAKQLAENHFESAVVSEFGGFTVIVGPYCNPQAMMKADSDLQKLNYFPSLYSAKLAPANVIWKSTDKAEDQPGTTTKQSQQSLESIANNTKVSAISIKKADDGYWKNSIWKSWENFYWRDSSQAPGVDGLYKHGVDQFDKGRIKVSETNLANAVIQQPDAPYSVLRLFLASSRLGKKSDYTLRGNSKALNLQYWPGPIVKFYLGEVTPAQVLASAHDADPKTNAGHLAEAYFYFAEQAVLDGKQSEAIPLLYRAIATGATDRYEYASALAEVKRLTRGQRAESGDPEAEAELGDCYRFGDCAKEDLSVAIIWYRKSAAQGYAWGQTMLASMYYYGKGVPLDYSQAFAWSRKAAEQNNILALSYVAALFENGKGVPQDLTMAAMWCRKAAELGDSWAQYHLGTLYYQGKGVPQDYTQAAMWFRKAADQGNTTAQTHLAEVNRLLAAAQATPAPVAPAQNNEQNVASNVQNNNVEDAAVQADAAAQEEAAAAEARRQEIANKIEELQSDIEQHEDEAEKWEGTAQRMLGNTCTGPVAPICQSMTENKVAEARANANQERNAADQDRAEIQRLQGEEASIPPPRDTTISGNKRNVNNPGYDPNAIVNAGNRQAEAIRAIGDANAKRRSGNATTAVRQPDANQLNASQSNSTSTQNGSAQLRWKPLATNCLSVVVAGDGYKFTNRCSSYIQVAVASPGSDGGPNGADTFQLSAGQSEVAGYTKARMKYWACAGSNSPLDVSTQQIPNINSVNVSCPIGGNANAAQ